MKNKDGYYKVYKDDLHDMCKLGLTQNLIEGWLEKIEERRDIRKRRKEKLNKIMYKNGK